MVLSVNERRVQIMLWIHVRVQVELKQSPHGPRCHPHTHTPNTWIRWPQVLALNNPNAADEELAW